MADNTWTAVESYFDGQLLRSDPDLEVVLQNNLAAGLPPHDVTPSQAAFLSMLVRIHRARRILEIGTLGGYSTIWLARALPPDGSVTTLEVNPVHAEIAGRNFEMAGVANQIELIEGEAVASLEKLANAAVQPFDFVFIDADKVNNLTYFQWALRLVSDRAVIIVDNVVRDGHVIEAASADPSVMGVRQLVAGLNCEQAVSSTAVQTVGSKGYDGFILAYVDRHRLSSEAQP
jgi:predicted O-methyltransferase YrrM